MVAKRKATDATANERPAYWDDALSPKQQAVFAFVRKYAREYGEGPATKDVIAALEDISASAIRYNLKALEQVDYLRPITDHGIVRWSPTGERALREARLWELVDQGRAHWAGGKPKGAYPPIILPPGASVVDLILEERERLRC